MMNMKKRHLALAAALIAAAGATVAPAQQPREGVAQLKGVKGNVLLSRQTGLAAGAESTRIVEHTRVITTANSEVVVVYDNGCEVRQQENQRFEVETDKPCAALVAQTQSILVEPAGTALSGGSAVAVIFWTTLPALGAGAVGAEILFGPKPTPLGPTPLSPS
jgi:hypothetical protein